MRATADVERKRRWPWYLLAGVLFVVLLFYVVGGWHFSNRLRTDLLEVKPPAESYDLTVVAVDAGSITLRENEGRDDELRSTGVYGVTWEGGSGSIEGISSTGATEVTRSFTVLDGEPPAAGAPADVNKNVFPPDPQKAHGVAFAEVEYDTPLGPMDAWHIPGDATTWAVMVHGKGADRTEALRVMQPFIDAGLPVLVVRYRNDLDSPLDPSGFYQYGVTEWEDVNGAVEYALDNGADDVVLVGLSTGAAHIASFLEKSELRSTVVGAVLDAPNIDIGRTVDYGASQLDLPLLGIPLPQSLTTVAKTLGEIRFGIDFSELDYTNRLANSGFPILVFHGTEDDTVPLDSSQRLEATAPGIVQLVVISDAFHVGSWNKGPSRYEDTVADFVASLVS